MYWCTGASTVSIIDQENRKSFTSRSSTAPERVIRSADSIAESHCPFPNSNCKISDYNYPSNSALRATYGIAVGVVLPSPLTGTSGYDSSLSLSGSAWWPNLCQSSGTSKTSGCMKRWRGLSPSMSTRTARSGRSGNRVACLCYLLDLSGAAAHSMPRPHSPSPAHLTLLQGSGPTLASLLVPRKVAREWSWAGAAGQAQTVLKRICCRHQQAAASWAIQVARGIDNLPLWVFSMAEIKADYDVVPLPWNSVDLLHFLGTEGWGRWPVNLTRQMICGLCMTKIQEGLWCRRASSRGTKVDVIGGPGVEGKSEPKPRKGTESSEVTLVRRNQEKRCLTGSGTPSILSSTSLRLSLRISFGGKTRNEKDASDENDRNEPEDKTFRYREQLFAVSPRSKVVVVVGEFHLNEFEGELTLGKETLTFQRFPSSALGQIRVKVLLPEDSFLSFLGVVIM
ncbi:hypothetical protein BC827DRAFT_1156063 [Russula dissimulans]|nr:hypothetical protein BC827DRAFT_1156063 [Russula dissimulans]